MSKLAPALKPLYDAALKARSHAHAPYSRCQVGAAIRTKKGTIFAGCNVENSSFGATVCAERGAIQTAVATEGELLITEMVVITDATPPWPPCGMCRQVITEFTRGVDPVVHACNLQGDCVSIPFSRLYAHPFTANELKQGQPS